LTSFTVWGSTSGQAPNNIDMNRFPAGGTVHYRRTITVSRLIADLIRDGNAVIVVHGIDYNYNHIYDFGALGVSDLDRTLPGEATAPALCGPLRPAPGTKSTNANVPATFVASLRLENTPEITSPTTSSGAIGSAITWALPQTATRGRSASG
jgi:hypothetical protein